MRPSVEGHQVAGVHVPVKEAVQDHALEPGAHADEQRVLAVDVRGAELLDVVDAVAEEPLHHQHARGGQLVDGPRRGHLGLVAAPP